MKESGKRASLPREFPGVHYYGDEEEAAVLRVIRQRSPFRYYGANFLAEADSLEREFAARLGRRHAQAVSSCTNGLVSAMAAFAVGPGQEVLLAGFARPATLLLFAPFRGRFSSRGSGSSLLPAPHLRVMVSVRVCEYLACQ